MMTNALPPLVQIVGMTVIGPGNLAPLRILSSAKPSDEVSKVINITESLVRLDSFMAKRLVVSGQF